MVHKQLSNSFVVVYFLKSENFKCIFTGKAERYILNHINYRSLFCLIMFATPNY